MVETLSRVIALPCSGSSGRQWRDLEVKLKEHFAVLGLDLMDHATALSAARGRDFTLMDEAAPLLQIIDREISPVHLVGHSYGGAVALRAALERPEKVASLTLFEPTPFHLLDETYPADTAALNAVYKVAWDVSRLTAADRLEEAAQIFVDYWAGGPAWRKLRPESREAIVRYAPKATLEFGALINEPMELQSYAGLETPLLILEGEYAPAPAHRIATTLMYALPQASHVVIPRVGHMAPVVQSELVASEIADHILHFTSSKRGGTLPPSLPALRNQDPPSTVDRQC